MKTGFWRTIASAAAIAALPLFTSAADTIDGVEGVHAVAMHGDVKYPPDFDHFDYADPDAPKGGILRLSAVTDGYDSFNIVPPRGHPAAGVNRLYETLTVKSDDEPFSKYGLLAEEIFMPEDRSWVAFRLHEQARWHDGVPITADDIIWSFNIFKEHGAPIYRLYYRDVTTVKKLDERTVRFDFATDQNKELPLILGDLSILPKHYWNDRDVTKTTLEPPLGSGPYRIVDFEGNRYVTYERVKDYWGKDLPVNRGRDNFDKIRYDYYADSSIAREAFKAGAFDIRSENSAKSWALGYEVPALENGKIVKQEFDDKTVQVMIGLIFNMRKPKFADRRVRRALQTVFDFQWTRETLFFGQYDRLRSFFGDGPLAAKGLPKGRELEILEPYKGQVPSEVFTREYNPPSYDGFMDKRKALLTASDLLEEAGWVIDPDSLKRVNANTGQPFTIEILMSGPTLQSVLLPVVRNLGRLGIDAHMNVVDSSQYIKRVRSRDFDAFWSGWAQSLSPGNEQRDYWSSAAADSPASRNYMGLKNPVVDELVEEVINAPSREELEARTRALDRVLQWQYLLLPGYYLDINRIAHWNKFGIPETKPWHGYDPDFWWYSEALAREHGLHQPTNLSGDAQEDAS